MSSVADWWDIVGGNVQWDIVGGNVQWDIVGGNVQWDTASVSDITVWFSTSWKGTNMSEERFEVFSVVLPAYMRTS
jgi:hypothetical protein